MPIFEPFSHSLPTNPAIWSHCPPTYTHPYSILPPCGPASRHNSNKTPAQRSRIIPSSKRKEKKNPKTSFPHDICCSFCRPFRFCSVCLRLVTQDNQKLPVLPCCIPSGLHLMYIYLIHANALNCSPVAYSERPVFKPVSRVGTGFRAFTQTDTEPWIRAQSSPSTFFIAV